MGLGRPGLTVSTTVSAMEDTTMTNAFLLAYAGSGAAGESISAAEYDRLKTQAEGTPREIRVGDHVRIRKGICGEGYRFTVTDIGTSGHGERILYGRNYGPVRDSEVEIIDRTAPTPAGAHALEST